MEGLFSGTHQQFRILKKHQDWLFKLAESAELNFSSDPNTSLIKIRQLGEAIAQSIAARIGVESGSSVKQIDLLKDLDYNLRLDDNVRDAFHTIRKLGNTATHQFDSTSHRCIKGDHGWSCVSYVVSYYLWR